MISRLYWGMNMVVSKYLETLINLPSQDDTYGLSDADFEVNLSGLGRITCR